MNNFFKTYPQFDRDDWRALVRPCVDIAFVDGDVASDDSCFGGKPFLPKEFEIPTSPDVYEFAFLGQFNLAQLSQIANPLSQLLPKTGLLSIFYNNDDDAFWGDDNFVKVFYFADTTDFVVHDDKDSEVSAVALAFADGVSLPCNFDLNVNYPSDVDEFYNMPDISKQYNMFDEAYDGVDDHLFGYPTNDSLGYDPTPTDGDWLPFLNLQSHNKLNWCWHDGDRLMLFIEKSALAQGDFGNIKTDAG